MTSRRSERHPQRAFTYYVDTVNGNDGNNGLTPGAAFATKAHADGLTLTAGQSVGLQQWGRFVQYAVFLPHSMDFSKYINSQYLGL